MQANAGAPPVDLAPGVRELLDALPLPVYATDAAGRLTYFNSAAAHFSGRTPELGTDRWCVTWKLFHPDGRAMAHEDCPMAVALRQGFAVYGQRAIAERPDGRRIAFRPYPVPLRGPDGRVAGAINVLVDITAEHESEQGIRDAEEQRGRLAAIVDSSDDAIVSKTLQGVITSWNRGAERMFGYRADEAVGRHITFIIPPERRSEEDDVLARLGRGEKIDHFETVRQAKDGRLLDISLSVSPVRGADGRIVGASKIARDITERKRAEAAMREADRRKDEFLATLSHELRNPLAPIRNAVELLRAAGDDAEIASHATGILERQVGHLVRLVDDLLDVARITHGQLSLDRRSVEAATVLQNALEISQPLIGAGAHRLELDLPPEPVWLLADPVRLSQVIGNLLNNAAKYTPRGGHIALSVRSDGKQASISVLDNGSGIAPGMLGRVFDLFAATDLEARRTRGGLGIGLSLSRRLVEMHGGTIEARSEGTGRGSEFIVRLPVLPGADLAEEGAAPSVPAVRRRRVVVVDDNVDAAESLALVLQRLGHEVHLAHDGLGAVEAARLHLPEVMLLDIDLPSLDGYGVASRLKADPRLGSIRLVALTGMGQDGDRARTRAAGFDAHLLKPVDPGQLGQLLATLDRTGTTSEL